MILNLYEEGDNYSEKPSGIKRKLTNDHELYI